MISSFQLFQNMKMKCQEDQQFCSLNFSDVIWKQEVEVTEMFAPILESRFLVFLCVSDSQTFGREASESGFFGQHFQSKPW